MITLLGRKLNFCIVWFLSIASILQSFGRYPRSPLAAPVGCVAASTAQRGYEGYEGAPMSWLRRGARVPRRVIRAHSVITKGAVTPEGDVREIFENTLSRWRVLRRTGRTGPETSSRTSPKCRRARAPSLFFNFFPSSVSEWAKNTGDIRSSLVRKRDMSYTESLWEINGNQAPVSSRASPVRHDSRRRFINYKKMQGRESVISNGTFSLLTHLKLN